MYSTTFVFGRIDIPLPTRQKIKNMPIPKTLARQNPKLGQKKLQDGRASLFLDFYLGRHEVPVLDENGKPVLYTEGLMAGKPKFKITHERRRESLNLYVWLNPRNAQERLQNKNTLALAEKIRFEREQEFLEYREGYRLQKDREQNFHEFFRKLYHEDATYTKSSKLSFRLIHNRFIKYLESIPRLQKYAKFMRFEFVTNELAAGFAEWLKGVCAGEGARKSFFYFKKGCTIAVEEGAMKKNPCNGIVIRCDANVLTKSILSPEEIERLLCTRYKQERPDIQRAFVFSLYTGLRFCDVKNITYANIDFATKTMRFNQIKSEGRSAHSHVVMPLSKDLMELIGFPRDPEDMSEKIFPLPDTSICSRHLKRWVKEAGINKHITWHCARHSFAVNLLNAGANIKTVSALLGHSSIKMTEKYLHVIDSQKKDAINSLGRISFKRDMVYTVATDDDLEEDIEADAV